MSHDNILYYLHTHHLWIWLACNICLFGALSNLEAMLQVDIDFETEPIGLGKDGKKIFFRDIWPSNKEVAEVSCFSVSIGYSLLKLLK